VARLERVERGITSACAAVWNDATRTRPGHLARRAREVGLGRLEPGDHRVGVGHEPPARLRELHAAADALDQPYARVALERRQLLGDGGRRVGQRLGDRGDRAPRGQLAQQSQAADVQHRVAELTGRMQKMSLDLNGGEADTVPMTSSPASLSLSLRHATPRRLRRRRVPRRARRRRAPDRLGAGRLRRRPPRGRVSLADGRAVADPFTRTADVVDLLRLRARQQGSGPARRLGLGRLGLAA
jgi:hypothetical protein